MTFTAQGRPELFLPPGHPRRIGIGMNDQPVPEERTNLISTEGNYELNSSSDRIR